MARYAHRAYLKALFRYTDLRDRQTEEKSGPPSVPPASLRYRVHGSVNMGTFLRNGRRCGRDVKSSLAQVGEDFDSFGRVLDFGCGCGRTLLWFAAPEGATPPASLHGTDIDAEAVQWCRQNLSHAEFSVNGALPPLAYPDASFDLVYAVSVFTHLDEGRQFLWLKELERITRLGGVVLLTVHGEHARGALPAEDAAAVERDGFRFVVSDSMRGIFPDWYQNAFHTKEYVLDRYAERFDVAAYIPRGMNNHQDVVVLRRN